jgi:hypothetical protein
VGAGGCGVAAPAAVVVSREATMADITTAAIDAVTLRPITSLTL